MRITYIFIAFILFSGCGKKTEKRPDNILSKSQMVEILQDIYLTESKISKLSVRYDSSRQIYSMLEDAIFDDHHMQDSTYRKSVQYYYDHPDKLLEIYEMVVDSLSLKEQQIQEATHPKVPGEAEAPK